MAEHHVLIIGCGSIGERHLRAFAASKRCRVTACDSRPAILESIGRDLGIPGHLDWQAALADRSVTAVVVATPAPSHVDLAREILAGGRHVLIEKPLALSMEGITSLQEVHRQSRRHAAIAYVQRFNPVISTARDFIRAGNWGPVLQGVLAAGQHFPTFRPAYREIYYRDPAQGGGCIHDALTHTVDGIGWILGPATQVYCAAEHLALEGVTVEDTVNLTARYGRTLVSFSHNQFQAPNEARWDFHLAGGSVRIELRQSRWGRFPRGGSDWSWEDVPHPGRDGQFLAQAQVFLDGCEGHPVNPACSLEEGIQTLRFTLAALHSRDTGLRVDLTPPPIPSATPTPITA